MQVTKQQIVNGIVKYSKNEMIPKISDKAFKMIVSAVTTMIELHPEVITKYLDNTMVSAIFMESDGFYDVDMMDEILEKTLEEYGDFSIKIPGIKFISPEEKELNFAATDVKRLKAYIVGDM